MDSDNNPFRVKGIAHGDVFYNRKQEIHSLIRAALGGQHTLVIAPRRFGKTSLMQHVAAGLSSGHSVEVVSLDLFKCPSEREFLNLLAREIVRSQRGPISKALASIRRGLPKLAPKLSVNALGEPEFSIDLESSPLSFAELEDLLLWFDSSHPGRKKLLVLDEIQELGSYENPGRAEKALRSIVQKLRRTTVFYSGSLPTLLKQMFFDRGRAFYQSAIRFDLGWTPQDEARRYLADGFRRSGRPAPDALLDALAEASRGHPYYVQLLGYLAWELLLEKKAWGKIEPGLILEVAFRREHTTFENAISLLTPQQRQVYRAICREPEAAITSRDFLLRHRLPAHASVLKAARKLEALGFVLEAERGFIPSDPLLALWWGAPV